MVGTITDVVTFMYMSSKGGSRSSDSSPRW